MRPLAVFIVLSAAMSCVPSRRMADGKHWTAQNLNVATRKTRRGVPVQFPEPVAFALLAPVVIAGSHRAGLKIVCENRWLVWRAGRIAALLLVNYGWELPRVPLRMAVKRLEKLGRP